MFLTFQKLDVWVILVTSYPRSESEPVLNKRQSSAAFPKITSREESENGQPQKLLTSMNAHNYANKNMKLAAREMKPTENVKSLKEEGKESETAQPDVFLTSTNVHNFANQKKKKN